MSSTNYVQSLADLRRKLSETKDASSTKKIVDELFLLQKELTVLNNSITYELNRGLEKHATETKTKISDNPWGITLDRDSHFAVSIVDGVTIPVERIKKLEYIPDQPVYYVEELDQFAIRIAGTLFRGNIGQIFNGRDNTKPKIKPLDSRAHNLSKFYMDPKKYNRPNIRNFSDSSWVYCKAPINRKNSGMRHIGSRERLRDDLETITEPEIDRLKDQLIHDLLVNICVAYR